MIKKRLYMAAGLSWVLGTAAWPAELTWQPWSDNLFKQAKAEHRLVILDLEAVWCHWCHVMNNETYSDPAVQALLRSGYITVRVDQDSRPDLSNRYENYGWPATIIFDSNGRELAKRQGYIPPKPMASMLKAFIDDPTPGPSVQKEDALSAVESPFLSAALQKKLRQSFAEYYDAEHGAWGTTLKFLDWDCVEYAMAQARKGDKEADHMARQTLDAQQALLDPVWGGVYQYSAGGDWKEPHFEKIMQMQAENMRIYALAYVQYHDPAYLKMAESIRSFLSTFLTSPDGSFYTSQDADLVDGVHSADYFALNDAGRRRKGIPRIDQHIYARENGWAIRALVNLYMASGKPVYLEEAEGAARAILKTRTLQGGGFSHDREDAAGPYLGDTLAMGRAFLDLYTATAEREWLTHAEEAADYIARTFQNSGRHGPAVGYLTSAEKPVDQLSPSLERDENIAVARFANLLFHYTGRKEYRQMAERAMRYLAIPQIAERLQTAGVLLANDELSLDPLHITIVGPRKDPRASALFVTALTAPGGYKRIEWWDPGEGRLPNQDVTYPQLKAPAAFVCAQENCSFPMSKPEALRKRLERI